MLIERKLRKLPKEGSDYHIDDDSSVYEAYLNMARKYGF
jgi:hypothetical protein